MEKEIRPNHSGIRPWGLVWSRSPLPAWKGAAFAGGFLSFEESSIKERIRSIMNLRKPTMLVLAVCVLVLVVLAAVFLANPSSQGESQPPLLPEGSSGESALPPEGEREPSSSSPSGTLEPVPGEEEPQEDLPLSNEYINTQEVERMTLLPAGTMVAYQVDGEDRERIAAAINQLSLAWEQEVREPDGADTVLVTGTDGEEYAFLVDDAQITGNGELLESTADQRAQLRQLIGQLAEELPAQPVWLASMPLERLSQVEYHWTSTDGQWQAQVDTEGFDEMWAAAEPFARLTCQPESWQVADGGEETGNWCRLTFDTGERYQVWEDQGRLTIRSVSRDQAVEYTLDPEEADALAQALIDAAREIPGSVLTLTVAE